MPATGFAVKARAAKLISFPPYGPPDMLYVRKRYVPVVGPSKLYGYYHFVRGVDVSHPAAISAYIVDVVRNKGLDPLSWVSTGGWEIASATFLSYNFIAKADAIVHVDFPGTTTANATQADGRAVETTDLFWKQLMVSSVVRDMARVGEEPVYPGLRVISPVYLRLEPLFLDSAADCASTWNLSGLDTMSGLTDFPSRSRIATCIRDYYLSHARYDTAIEFFLRESVRNADPDCAVHAASAAREKGDMELANSIIDDVIAANSKSELAWTERAQVLRATGELEKALEAAKTASSYADEDSIHVWVVLADLYADLKQHSKAFEALNSLEIPPPALDPFLMDLVPNRKNTTSPIDGASHGYDAVRILANRLREEKNMSSEKTDDTLSELGKLLTEIERSCYAVLVKILNELSWDEMLSVRGECFVMETDVENGQIPETDEPDTSEEEDERENPTQVVDGIEPEPIDGVEAQPNGHTDVAGEDSTVADAGNGLAEIAINVAEENEAHSSGDGENEGADSSDLSEVRLRSLERIGKQVCKPWLDYLVFNMYRDLRALALWNAEEQQHSAAAALHAARMSRRSEGDSMEGDGSSSRDDLESSKVGNDYRRSADEVATTTKRPPADWLRRGELALRLGKIEEAKTAYWTSVKLATKEKVVAITALCRIMKLSSNDSDTKTALKCADAIWNYIDANCDRKQSSEPTVPVTDVRTCIFQLISKKGLRSVRDMVTSKVEVDRKRMERLILDSVALQVDGFTR